LDFRPLRRESRNALELGDIDDRETIDSILLFKLAPIVTIEETLSLNHDGFFDARSKLHARETDLRGLPRTLKGKRDARLDRIDQIYRETAIIVIEPSLRRYSTQ